MSHQRARWFWGAGLVTAGLVAGILLTSSLDMKQPDMKSLKPAAVTTASASSQEQLSDDEALRMVKATSRAFVAVARQVTPTVVTITSERMIRPSDYQGAPPHEFFGDDFMQRFFGRRGPESFRQRGLGSGVIVSPDGYILTNNHVVGEADKLQVILSDERRFDAKVVGTDPESDIAVVKIDERGLQSARLGDSEQTAVGEWVLAIGSPFQLDATVTLGIVSAKSRSNMGLASYEDFIQTDAAINPGNSGGALVNLDGELIGINTAIATRTGGYQGVGFAIPISMARTIMDQLIESGKVTRGFLGVTIQDVNEDTAKSLDLDSAQGALIAQIATDGPAGRAGLEVGDVIVKLEGRPVKNVRDLMRQVAATKPGRKVGVTIWRDKKERNYNIEVAERPHGDVAEQFGGGEGGQEPESGGLLGLSVQPVTPDLAERLEIDPESKGLVVTDVMPGGPADEAGVQTGDLIRRVNKAEMDSARGFRDALKSLKEGDTVLLLLERDGRTFFRPLKVESR
jgi:serine protease Do